MAQKNKASYQSESVFQKRVRNFKKIKRGYYSLIIIGFLYFLSFFNPAFVNDKPLMLQYEGETYYPVLIDLFGGLLKGEHYDVSKFSSTSNNYRQLKQEFATQGNKNSLIMPLYPYGPLEILFDELAEGETPPTAPSAKHFFGTDTQARDIFVRAVYGFQISISFALIVTILSYIIGIFVGGILGYYGGQVDIIGLRLIEIFAILPFLFMILILVKFMQPSFIVLALIIVILTGWVRITFFVRGEFFREKAKDYVAAAKAMGASDLSIMFKHILPNALVSVITFAPFAIIANISSLVALDFLGFGLPTPTPSWGELIQQGSQNINSWWLIVTPLFMIFITLNAVSFIGEGVRQAFDPKEYSRLQ